MTEPYNAVGLIPTVWGISKREDIFKNIEHHRHITKAACWLSDIDFPVKLLIFPEGALQGFNDEVLDADHVDFANTCAIDIPGHHKSLVSQPLTPTATGCNGLAFSGISCDWAF